MKESDALKKWCPFARVWGARGAYNRDSKDNLISPCIGSACMAWQGRFTVETPEIPHGHCGLVGGRR